MHEASAHPYPALNRLLGVLRSGLAARPAGTPGVATMCAAAKAAGETWAVDEAVVRRTRDGQHMQAVASLIRVLDVLGLTLAWMPVGTMSAPLSPIQIAAEIRALICRRMPTAARAANVAARAGVDPEVVYAWTRRPCKLRVDSNERGVLDDERLGRRLNTLGSVGRTYNLLLVVVRSVDVSPEMDAAAVAAVAMAGLPVGQPDVRRCA